MNAILSNEIFMLDLFCKREFDMRYGQNTFLGKHRYWYLQEGQSCFFKTGKTCFFKPPTAPPRGPQEGPRRVPGGSRKRLGGVLSHVRQEDAVVLNSVAPFWQENGSKEAPKIAENCSKTASKNMHKSRWVSKPIWSWFGTEVLSRWGATISKKH